MDTNVTSALDFAGQIDWQEQTAAVGVLTSANSEAFDNLAASISR